MACRNLAVAILSAVTLVSCSAAHHESNSRPAVRSIDVAQCRENGGEIRNVGILQLPSCVVPYADAGKTCSDSAECEGACLLLEQFVSDGTQATGQCQQTNSLFGCFATIEQGVANATICVD
jgi:hypothetical protein